MKSMLADAIAKSMFADVDTFSAERQADFTCSFLQGVAQLLEGNSQDGTFRIVPSDYSLAGEVPAVLRDGDRLVGASVSASEKKSVDGYPEFTVHVEKDVDGRKLSADYHGDDISARDAFELMTFLFLTFNDGEYEDVDEYYGYELS